MEKSFIGKTAIVTASKEQLKAIGIMHFKQGDTVNIEEYSHKDSDGDNYLMSMSDNSFSYLVPIKFVKI